MVANSLDVNYHDTYTQHTPLRKSLFVEMFNVNLIGLYIKEKHVCWYLYNLCHLLYGNQLSELCYSNKMEFIAINMTKFVITIGNVLKICGS